MQFVFHDPSEYDAYLFPLYVRIRFHLSAPGYRSDANGTLHFVCSYGYVWSSKTNNIRSHNLHFSAPWLNPSYAYYRANGYQLRCLSE
ncbi:hypothetical protein [uncultured Rikenella sp.]|uniref:hypothetical protein n=1 Tax=uncultured Rikenella sp. TaxID=368003 RepID=UPI002628F50E|nr:hypothetical protein [uncultured Rikenella sp.]